MNTVDLIAEARKLVVAEPSAGVWDDVLRRKPPVGATEVHPITFFTYRCKGVGDEEFRPILEHWRVMTGKFHPLCQRITCSDFGVDMFKRAMAMCSFAHSDSFNSPTVFLDADAFPNADLLPIFATIRDIGLTYRDTPGLMPINEGVIFAQPTDAARAFFRVYLGTYEACARHFGGDVKTWWGGQLALNAITIIDDDGLRFNGVKYFKCDIYNFSPDTEADLAPAVLDTKAVIHLKGPRKALFERVRAYQEAR